jgi:hypothetical protein
MVFETGLAMRIAVLSIDDASDLVPEQMGFQNLNRRSDG